MYQSEKPAAEIAGDKLAFVADLTKVLDTADSKSVGFTAAVMQGLRADAKPSAVLTAAAIVAKHPQVVDDIRREYARQRRDADFDVLNTRGLKRGTVYVGNYANIEEGAIRAAESKVDLLFDRKADASRAPVNDVPLAPMVNRQITVGTTGWQSASPHNEIPPNGRPLASVVRSRSEISADKLQLVANLSKEIRNSPLTAQEAKVRILAGCAGNASYVSTVRAAIALQAHPALLSDVRELHAQQRVRAEIAALNHDGNRRATVYSGNSSEGTAQSARESADTRFDAMFRHKGPLMSAPGVSVPGQANRTLSNPTVGTDATSIEQSKPIRDGAEDVLAQNASARKIVKTGVVAARVNAFDSKPHPYGHGPHGGKPH